MDATDASRDRIVAAAAALVADQGRDALTTRAVATAAGVQAPTIYRLFGDKNGLVDAVVEHGFTSYLADKRRGEPADDPVDELRAGWDLHIGFGLANPGLYALMAGDPRPGSSSPAATAAQEILRRRVGRIAAAGRLRVDERLAVMLVHAAGQGTVLALLDSPEHERDARLSEAAREAVIARITTAPAVDEPGPAAAAVALRAQLSDTTALGENERALLAEWLDRIAAG